jgi:multisubunit Na+/H+ antiporter MnhB subunit
VIAEFGRLAGAVLLAFAGMLLVRSQLRPLAVWVLRAAVALACFAGALWIVYRALPFPVDPSMPTFSIVGSAVFIAGLAVEELVGADIRRILRM